MFDNRQANRARKGWIHAAKSYGHPRKKAGKRASSKALRRVGKALCRSWK